MKPFKSVVICTLAVMVAGSFAATGAAAKQCIGQRAKNIIFMLPDGMGLPDVTAARIFKFGPNGDRLTFEKMPVIGYHSTHSANSTVTDSAAAASAWASGAKYNNGEISCHDDDVDGACDGDPGQTILDMAKAKGKATGLVATSDITHATPAETITLIKRGLRPSLYFPVSSAAEQAGREPHVHAPCCHEYTTSFLITSPLSQLI